MADDDKLAALLTECLRDLRCDTPAGDVRALDALRQIEAEAPGQLRAMAENLVEARAGRARARAH